MRYEAGLWFEVPLGGGKSAIGLIVAIGQTGTGYFAFFNVLVDSPASLSDCGALTARDVIYSIRTGTSELERGGWRSLGFTSTWDRRDWPMPLFVRSPVLDTQYYAVEYDVNDPGVHVRTVPISEEDARGLPSSGVWTATTARAWLRRHFGIDEPDDPEAALDEPVAVYALRIRLIPSSDDASMADILDLQDAIEERLNASGLGDLDGDESGRDGTDLFLTGRDGWKILAEVSPLLEKAEKWHPTTAQVRTERGAPITLDYDLRRKSWARRQ